MRALTLKPHWAHAIAHYGKRCENRSRPIPPALIGQRVAIHAGASLPKGWGEELGEFGDMTTSESPHPEVMAPDRFSRPILTRHIVATAVLAESCEADIEAWVIPRYAWARPRWWDWSDPTAKWWWRLADVQVLTRPVHVQRGQLGLWSLQDDVASQVAAGAP